MKRIWVDQEKCLACKSCELACAVMRDSVHKTLLQASREVVRPTPRVSVHGRTAASFPMQCRHCQDAPCLAACPSGAMQRDLETGVVFIDQARCRGCFMCVMTCPFGCVVPASNYPVAQKCDLCLHREERACVEACPTDALIYADENEFAKVLAAKRGKVALFAQAAAPDHQLDLDYVQEGE